MAVIEDRLIAAYAMSAGFIADDAVIAVAIALAESRGDPAAHKRGGFVPTVDVYGLWQINFGDSGTARIVQAAVPETKMGAFRLFDPIINAKAAYALYKNRGGHFGDWSTYLTGAYRMFMGRAKEAVDKAGNIVVGGTPGATTSTQVGGKIPDILDALNPLNVLQKFFTWALEQLKPFVTRLAAFIGGGVLIILAIVLYIRRGVAA